MKMFIWADPYRVSFGSSICYAVANTVEEAKDILWKSKMYKYGLYNGKTLDGSEDTKEWMKLGEPTRILDLPCGEWNEVSE